MSQQPPPTGPHDPNQPGNQGPGTPQHGPWHPQPPQPPPHPWGPQGFAQPGYGHPPQAYGPPHYPPMPGNPYGGPPYSPPPGQPGQPLSSMPPRRGFPILAWLVIVAAVLFIAGSQFVMKQMQSSAQPDPETSASSLFLVRAQSQAILAAAKNGTAEDREYVHKQLRELLDAGSLEQRLGFVIMTYELKGQREARIELTNIHDLYDEYKSLDLEFSFSEKQLELLRVADKIYLRPEIRGIDASDVQPPEPVTLTSDEQTTLEEQLGWFGELAITHAMPDNTQLRREVENKSALVATTFVVFVVLVGALGVAGFIGLIVMLVLLLIGTVKMNFRQAIPDGGIYAETFAIWLIALFGLQFVGGMLLGEAYMLEIALASFFISLLAVFWPVARGIPWRDVRHEIGWHTGKGVIVEFAAGIASYAMTLPIAAVGLLMTLLLMAISNSLTPIEQHANPFTPLDFPAHPIVNSTGGLDWVKALMILLVASVAAPIVEETMFRGVLYRTMRNATRFWPRFLSVAIGAIVVSLIFAVIHPQGLLAVPALAALAIGMTLTREWRDSLIASMVLHGTSNGIVMTLMLMLA